jgi:hypothetical protein
MSEPPAAPLPEEEPARWPDWDQRVDDPAGGRWRVRTVDLLAAPGQFAPAEARTIAANMGRYQTTVERPDGGLRTVYIFERDEAEEYHRRTVARARQGRL